MYYKHIFITTIFYKWFFSHITITIKLHSLPYHKIAAFKMHTLMKRFGCDEDRTTMFTLVLGILTILTFQMRSANTLLSFTQKPTTQMKKYVLKSLFSVQCSFHTYLYIPYICILYIHCTHMGERSRWNMPFCRYDLFRLLRKTET